MSQHRLGWLSLSEVLWIFLFLWCITFNPYHTVFSKKCCFPGIFHSLWKRKCLQIVTVGVHPFYVQFAHIRLKFACLKKSVTFLKSKIEYVSKLCSVSRRDVALGQGRQYSCVKDCKKREKNIFKTHEHWTESEENSVNYFLMRNSLPKRNICTKKLLRGYDSPGIVRNSMCILCIS